MRSHWPGGSSSCTLSTNPHCPAFSTGQKALERPCKWSKGVQCPGWLGFGWRVFLNAGGNLSSLSGGIYVTVWFLNKHCRCLHQARSTKRPKVLKSKGIWQRLCTKSPCRDAVTWIHCALQSRTSGKGMTKMEGELPSSECLHYRCYCIWSSHTPFSDETTEAKNVKRPACYTERQYSSQVHFWVQVAFFVIMFLFLPHTRAFFLWVSKTRSLGEMRLWYQLIIYILFASSNHKF